LHFNAIYRSTEGIPDVVFKVDTAQSEANKAQIMGVQ
jgi:hypothetical protein